MEAPRSEYDLITVKSVSKHAKLFLNGSSHHPQLYRYMRIGFFGTEQELVADFIEIFVNAQPSILYFAIIDGKEPTCAVEKASSPG
jgi:hypothetical protein